jgi:hypothetical protein
MASAAAPDAFVKREGLGGTWLHVAQDAGEAHINIVLAAFVPASYLAVAPLSHWPDVLSAARHVGHSAEWVKLVKLGSAPGIRIEEQEERIFLLSHSANLGMHCATFDKDQLY